MFLLVFKLLSFFSQLFSFQFQACHPFFIVSYLSQKFSICILFVQKFLNKGFSAIHTCRSFDIFEGNFNSIEFCHFSCHFISQQSFNESSTEVDLVPIFLFGIFILKGTFCNFFHLKRSNLFATNNLLFLVKHGLNTVKMSIPLSFLVADVINQFVFHFLCLVV